MGWLDLQPGFEEPLPLILQFGILYLSQLFPRFRAFGRLRNCSLELIVFIVGCV